MKLAIMQPYIFPYIGYFQLIDSVDIHVIYDDVSFIKNGWINRNNILSNDGPTRFTVPLFKQSSHKNIKDTLINPKEYPSFLNKFHKTLSQNYSKAPYYNIVSPLIDSVVNSEFTSISDLAFDGIQKICNILNIDTTLIPSSTKYNNADLSAHERVIDICQQEGANIYINVASGRKLYSKDDFENAGIFLRFVEPSVITYNQNRSDFIPNLSIIDSLMFIGPESTRDLLKMRIIST